MSFRLSYAAASLVTPKPSCFNSLRMLSLAIGTTVLSTGLMSAQCPAFGADSTCGVIITITIPSPGAAAQAALTFTQQGPYDGNDDTLVGVVNNTSVPLRSLDLNSTNNIFGFDGDGIDTYGAPGNSMDDTGYGGPNTYFTNYSSTTSGTVNFVTPLAANGGSTYFSLENALGSGTVCTSIINNSISPNPPSATNGGIIASGTAITFTFSPNGGYTLADAATLCGFTDFDWVQTITHIPDPNPRYARNLGGAFDPAASGPVRLTSAYSGKVSDPPQGGGYSSPFLPTSADYSYPFYCLVTGDPVCPKSPSSSPTSITFNDQPRDPCLVDSSGNPSAAYLKNPAIMAACQDKTGYPTSFTANLSPIGSYKGYTTHLAGVTYPNGPNAAPVPVDTGLGYSWKSTFNNTAGGIIDVNKSLPAPPDPGGSGGVTITGVNEITGYQYPKSFGVTGINGAPVSSSPSPAALLTQVSATASGLAYSRTTKSFDSTVTITNIGNSTVSGPFQIVLDSLTTGVTLANATSTFGGWPYVMVSNVGALAPNQSASVNVQFSDTSYAAVYTDLVVYSGSFN